MSRAQSVRAFTSQGIDHTMTAEEADISTIDHSLSLTPAQMHAGTGALLGSAIGDALGMLAPIAHQGHHQPTTGSDLPS